MICLHESSAFVQFDIDVLRRKCDLVGKGCAEVELEAVVSVFVPSPNRDIELALLAIHVSLHTKQWPFVQSSSFHSMLFLSLCNKKQRFLSVLLSMLLKFLKDD